MIGAGLQRLAQPALQRLELIGSGHAPGAPAEHHVAQAQQALPDTPGLPRALGDAGKVAQQVALQAALSQRLNPSCSVTCPQDT